MSNVVNSYLIAKAEETKSNVNYSPQYYIDSLPSTNTNTFLMFFSTGGFISSPKNSISETYTQKTIKR